MTDHPSTFNGGDVHTGNVDWDDYATLHLKEGGDGLLSGLKAIESGTLAQMIARVVRMPAEERGRYVIEKAGDHRLSTAEIMALAARTDFPR